MSKIWKQTVALLAFMFLGSSVAQNAWSGLIFGLPEEATDVALYVIDIETLAAYNAQSGGAQSGDGESEMSALFTKVASGRLNKDGTFEVKANLEAVQAANKALTLRQIFTAFSVPGAAKINIFPEDARVTPVLFGIENQQGSLIGTLKPRTSDDQLSMSYPYILFAHEPTLAEGVVDTSETAVVFDTVMSQGFNLLQSGVEISFFDAQMVINSMSESPQQWTYGW